MSEWPATTLGDVAELFVGHAFNSGTFTDETRDVRLLRGINVGVGAINWSSTKYWPRKLAGELGELHLKMHDVVVAMDRPWIDAGLKVASIRTEDVPSLLVQRVARLRASPQLHQGYLRATVGSDHFAAYLRSLAGGTAVPHVSASDIQNFSFPLPPLAIQRRIAAVLAAFDELIEINERRIALLEDLARSLYREWFVHFRFPGHEEVEFVNSELGTVPEGWQVRKLDHLCDVVRGRSYRRIELSEAEGVPFLNLKCLNRGGGFRRSGLKRYTGSFKDTQRAFAGDVLLAVTDMTQDRRIVAQAFRLPDLGEPFAVPSLDLALLKPRYGVSSSFLYASLRYSGFSDKVRHFANGANVLHLALERIEEQGLVVPPGDLVGRFAGLFDPLLAEAEALERNNLQWAATRDLLLPRLVTGRLDISDVDLGDLLPADAA